MMCEPQFVVKLLNQLAFHCWDNCLQWQAYSLDGWLLLLLSCGPWLIRVTFILYLSNCNEMWTHLIVEGVGRRSATITHISHYYRAPLPLYNIFLDNLRNLALADAIEIRIDNERQWINIVTPPTKIQRMLCSHFIRNCVRFQLYFSMQFIVTWNIACQIQSCGITSCCLCVFINYVNFRRSNNLVYRR